jgi:hypothetical protein
MANCLNSKCGKPLTKTGKTRYCSDACRQQAHRDKVKTLYKTIPIGEWENLMDELTRLRQLTKNVIQKNGSAKIAHTDILPMPERMIGENAIDFAARKSKWKVENLTYEKT